MNYMSTMNQRINEERDYWNEAALDPKVDEKYISNLTEGFDEVLGNMEGEVLEIGCGVGRLLKPGYHGIDISKNMLEIARSRHPENTITLSDGRTIPYPSNKFDHVYCVLVFQHLKDDGVRSYLQEACRVLKPGGSFTFQFIPGTEQEPFSNHYEIGSMSHWVVEAGFDEDALVRNAIHPSWLWMRVKKPDSKEIER